MTEPPNLYGRSGLPDARLAELWAEIRTVYPDACDRLAWSHYLDEEEAKRSTSFIRSYLGLHHGDVKHWPDRYYLYLDLLDYWDRERRSREPSS